MIVLSGTWLKERASVSHSLSLQERTKKTIVKIEKEAEKRFKKDYDDSLWKKHIVPGAENPPPDRYEGGVWYRRKFSVPAEYKGEFIRLQFEAANYTADVWINGKWAGSHEGGYTPFSFDITPYIDFSAENTIAVRIDNIPWDSRKDIVPYKTCDWWNYGGITRNVYIEICSEPCIANAYVRKTTAGIILYNRSGNVCKSKLNLEVWDTEVTEKNITDMRQNAIINGENPLWSISEEIIFKQGEIIKEIKIPIKIKSPKLWGPNTPALYVLELSLDNGDKFHTQFGFRNVEVKRGRLFLNGKMINLNGTARHEVFGKNPEFLFNDLKMIKEMNVNFLRTGHYPNEPELYIFTDRMGILVWEEIPVYWFDAGGFNIQAKRGIADKMWLEMIQRDFNRPSIIFWGTCNECATQKERKEFLKRLYSSAYRIDGTRLVAQSASGSDPLDKTQEVCDVIGVTMYYGIFYGKDYYRDTLKALEIIHSSFPEKPIIVTEYGIWSNLDLSSAEKQIAVAEKTLNAIFEKPYVTGWTWWCAFDWYSQITTFQTMGTITLNRDYVKPIYYYLQKIYGGKQSPLTVEILDPYNCATIRGIVEIKTKIEPSNIIKESSLLINGESVNPFSYKWDTTALSDGEYVLILKAKDKNEITQTSIKKVFVDNIDNPPSITINIADGEWLMHGKNIEIQLSDDRSPPMDLKANLVIDGEEKELASAVNGRFSYKWDLDTYPDKSMHLLTVKAYDGNDNSSENSTGVTVDNSPGTYIKIPYNHDWISCNENMSDGTGWDFPAEELPESNIDFICNKKKFIFGDKKDGGLNNLECAGQTLEIKPHNYSALYILASSHDGSSSEDLTFIYEDGTTESVPIAVSDWWSGTPMFDEETTLKCTHHHERNSLENPPGVGIYMITVPVNPAKKLKAVRLPDEPKMHIFSISLT